MVDTTQNLASCISFFGNFCEITIKLIEQDDLFKLKAIFGLLKSGAELESLIIEGTEKEPFCLFEKVNLIDLAENLGVFNTLSSFTISNCFYLSIGNVVGLSPLLKHVLPLIRNIEELHFCIVIIRLLCEINRQ